MIMAVMNISSCGNNAWKKSGMNVIRTHVTLFLNQLIYLMSSSQFPYHQTQWFVGTVTYFVVKLALQRSTFCSVNMFNSSFTLGTRNRKKSNVSSPVAKHQKNGISCTYNDSIYISKRVICWSVQRPQIHVLYHERWALKF